MYKGIRYWFVIVDCWEKLPPHDLITWIGWQVYCTWHISLLLTYCAYLNNCYVLAITYKWQECSEQGARCRKSLVRLLEGCPYRQCSCLWRNRVTIETCKGGSCGLEPVNSSGMLTQYSVDVSVLCLCAITRLFSHSDDDSLPSVWQRCCQSQCWKSWCVKVSYNKRAVWK